MKFTESGEVTLRVVAVGDGFNPVPMLYRFEIIDTGVGITPEAQAKIFDPFYQGEQVANKGGTGLGLAISKRYIQLMGGKLYLESPPLNPPQFGGDSPPLHPPVYGGKEGGQRLSLFLYNSSPTCHFRHDCTTVSME